MYIYIYIYIYKLKSSSDDVICAVDICDQWDTSTAIPIK